MVRKRSKGIMSAETNLERRLAALESAFVELQKIVLTERSENWIEEIAGTFKDEPAFDEILAYGRAFRQADSGEDDALDL
jgi:hypothetical protein